MTLGITIGLSIGCVCLLVCVTLLILRNRILPYPNQRANARTILRDTQMLPPPVLPIRGDGSVFMSNGVLIANAASDSKVTFFNSLLKIYPQDF